MKNIVRMTATREEHAWMGNANALKGLSENFVKKNCVQIIVMVMEFVIMVNVFVSLELQEMSVI